MRMCAYRRSQSRRPRPPRRSREPPLEGQHVQDPPTLAFARVGDSHLAAVRGAQHARCRRAARRRADRTRSGRARRHSARPRRPEPCSAQVGVLLEQASVIGMFVLVTFGFVRAGNQRQRFEEIEHDGTIRGVANATERHPAPGSERLRRCEESIELRPVPDTLDTPERLPSTRTSSMLAILRPTTPHSEGALERRLVRQVRVARDAHLERFGHVLRDRGVEAHRPRWPATRWPAG